MLFQREYNYQASSIPRFCSCVSGGLFCIELIRAHQGVEFASLHLSFVFFK